jgi:polar amino acid transport system permease protein
MDYQWDFGAVWQYRDMFWTGIIGTAQLAGLAIGLGILVGLGIALMRLSPKRYLSVPATIFVEFYRNTPPLVHFFGSFTRCRWWRGSIYPLIGLRPSL